MTLKELAAWARNKNRFMEIRDYVIFCQSFLEHIDKNLQAIIVSQNENNYYFYQFNASANYKVSRPVNSNLMYDADSFCTASSQFIDLLHNIKEVSSSEERKTINQSIYTMTLAIGCSLDAIEEGHANTARKLYGDLFESFIRLIIQAIGIQCRSGNIKVPIIVDENQRFEMSYQHDLVIEQDQTVKVLGSVKTSSKDRLDKIFIDKFLYSKLTETTIPHIAIFLNDLQRKESSKKENKYGINSTFLSGHFKGYWIKLNPLDGVYYCDLRPNMKTDNFLSSRIKTFDKLICDDIWELLS